MNIKEFAIKVGYDRAAMDLFKKDMETTGNAARKLGQDVSKDMNILDRSVTQGTNSAGAAFRRVVTTFREGGKDITLSFDTVNGAVQENSIKMVEGANKAQSLAQAFDKIGERALLVAPVWLALRAALTSLIGVFRDSISFMIEWETQMARIRVVTGASKETVDILSGSIIQVAEKFGISNKEVAESANEWLRMGATLADVIPKLEVTARLSLISGQSMAESAKAVNSIISSYGLNINQATSATEKLLDIEAKSGVSLDVLQSAFEKAGTKAKQAGISFDQFAGYVAAVNQKTRQSGELIGTQLLNVFNRLGGSAIESAQQISRVSFYLDSAGKATSVATAEFRPLNDIIRDLAQSWKTLGIEQQDQLAKQLGGAKTTSTIIALMENFGEAVKATSSKATDAQKEIDIALDTTGKHIKTLQDAWGLFSKALDSTGFFKFFIDTAKRNVDEFTKTIAIAHIQWDKLFNKEEFDKKIRAFDDLKKAQDKVTQPSGINGVNEADKKSKELAEQELAIKAQTIARENEILQIKKNQTVVEAQLKAEGASKLQIDIAHLGYLQAINDAKGAEAQKAVIEKATIEQFRSVQDEIITALIAEQNTLGETNLMQIQHKITLEGQLGIHLQGIDLLKEQLGLYKAISDEVKKTPLDRLKEATDLIKKTPLQLNSFQRSAQERLVTSQENRLIEQGSQRGISRETIEGILHPNVSDKTGGLNSLQSQLRSALIDPLTTHIARLSETIDRLASSITNPRIGPNLETNTIFQHPLTSAQGTGARSLGGLVSLTAPDKQPITVEIGGIHVTVSGHNKEEIAQKVAKITEELVSAHLVKPGTKVNNATKKVIENY